MTRLLTTEIAAMSEMREPQKVLDRAKGRPVAVMKNSKPVGYSRPRRSGRATGRASGGAGARGGAGSGGLAEGEGGCVR